MSFQEKRTTTTMLSGIIMIVAYIITVSNKVKAGLLAADDLRGWAITMLTFIGIGIVITIIIQILFHISMSVSFAVESKIQNRECDETEIEKTIKLEMQEDERDRMVNLKANQIGFGVAGGGFVAALLALVFNATPAVMMNIIFAGFFVGSFIEGAAQIYYYRRGI